MKRFLIYLLVVVKLWLLAFVVFLFHISIRPPENRETHTDAIAVLTGSSERLAVALNLLDEGQAPELFISGVGGGAELSSIYPDPASKQKLERLKGQIIIGSEAPDTVGNAIETLGWMKSRNHKTLRLVTSNYHMPRSRMEFWRAGKGDITIVEHPVLSIDISDGVPPNGARVAWLLFKEYNKFLAATVRASVEKLLGIA